MHSFEAPASGEFRRARAGPSPRALPALSRPRVLARRRPAVGPTEFVGTRGGWSASAERAAPSRSTRCQS
eukprot:15447615-Alexandrium_andersonii.AAC.1